MEKKIKIAYIAHNRFPTEKAHGVQISAMCSAFAEHGADVSLFVMRYSFWGKNIEQKIQAAHRISQSVSIISIYTPFIIFFGKIGYYLQIAFFVLRTMMQAKAWQADVVFTRDEITALIWMFFKKKVVLEVHTQRGSLWWGLLSKKVQVITISEGLRKFFLKKVPQANVKVFHDGVNYEVFASKLSHTEARKRVGISDLGPMIVYTGHLYDWKGVRTLLDAFTNSQNHFLRSSVLYMVGGTEHHVDQFKKEYNHPSIKFVGHVDYSLIPYFIHSAQVAVIPNSARDIIAREYTSPLKLFEYMAAGISIVASKVPAIQEVVDEDTVYFMEPDNALSCEQALIDALSSDQQKANRAQELAKKYSWSGRAHGIMQLLH